jgi:PBP1b-binding outer membrane lipoprotein LpoB
MMPTTMTKRIVATAALTACLLQSCNSCRQDAPVRQDGPVSFDKYRDLLREATTELLGNAHAQIGNENNHAKVAVFPIVYKGNFDHDSNSTAFEDDIFRQLADSGQFTPVPTNIVATAMRNAQLGTATDLFLSTRNKAFFEHLKKEGCEPTLALFTEFDGLKTVQSDGTVQSSVTINLRLVNPKTGAVTSSGNRRMICNGLPGPAPSSPTRLP